MNITATVSAMQLRQSIGALLNRVQYAGERIVVERQGKPVAALVGLDVLQRLEQLDQALGAGAPAPRAGRMGA